MLHVGLDVGSVSVKLAALGAREDSAVLSLLAETSSAFFAPRLPAANGWAERPVVCSAYRRIQGNPLQAASELLREFYAIVPQESISGIRFTGSGGRTVAAAFEAEFENDFRTLVRCIRALYPQVRTVFEMGGEASKYIRLSDVGSSSNLGVLDYQSSTECAAGTGSFIDQQASRLRYDVEDVGEAACHASCAARVAGRCSVFAKTDMIHAQQKGYTADQILRGLCDAVARNFKSSIVKGRQIATPVAFVGGVALNAGVYEALREAFGLRESDCLVPDLNCWMPALGASICGVEAGAKRTTVALHQVPPQIAAGEEIPTTGPLSLNNVTLLNRAPAVALPQGAGCVDAYLGIDVGSVSTNLVVL
ncbi:MAG TPA: BadF/BadG/BcrA/BcrD ATPase family protein, partial [Candidatus Acidoferrales bacterium]|nr:BadF/BadG/BcrA/BcrD ATPase family protein [Candidatus Acidoferrales bacterium]